MSGDIGRSYLDRASILLQEARKCLDRVDWALCILRSAECVEFSLKAALLLVGASYRREHDVANPLAEHRNKFPEWFSAKVPRFVLISRIMTSISLSAKYGDEMLGSPPGNLFERHEAEAYLRTAEGVYGECNRLFYELTIS